MIKRKQDQAVLQTETRLEKDLASRKPSVKMDDNFQIGLRNELLAEYAVRHGKKTEKTQSPGLFSRGWVKGMAGVFAVVVISAVTVYVNRAQFLPKQAPSETIENTLPKADQLSTARNFKPSVEKAKKEDRLKQAERERPADELAVVSEEQSGPSGQIYDDKAPVKTRSRYAPAPETKEESLEEERKEPVSKMKDTGEWDNLAGVSMSKKTAESPAVILEYRFGGRPAAFEEIEKKLKQGIPPSKSSIKVDELVSEFSYGKNIRPSEPMSVHTETAVSPWNANNFLLLIVVRAGTTDESNAPVAENAVLKFRLYGGKPVQKIPSGGYYYSTVYSPVHAESAISGTFLSEEQASIIIEVPTDKAYSGQLFADGEIVFRKNGESTNRIVLFSLKYGAQPGEPSSETFRTASAAMFWGKILAGTIPPESTYFTHINRLLEGVGSKKNALDKSRLRDAVKMTRQLMGK